MIDDYDAKLEKARMCNDTKENACAATVPAKLAGCGSECITYVDKPGPLNELIEKWKSNGCTASACLISVCVNPVSSSCSASTGSCTDSLL